MENFETYVDQISTALELTSEQKEQITTIFSGFKDNEKLQLISQTQNHVDELIKADEVIKTLKIGSLSQYMNNIQANWNMMSENLVQLQILSLIQKKGADCSEVINDLLKILNTKLTTVNQILLTNLGEASSKTTSTPTVLQKEVLGKADQAVKLAATKPDAATKSDAATKPDTATKPASSVLAKAAAEAKPATATSKKLQAVAAQAAVQKDPKNLSKTISAAVKKEADAKSKIDTGKSAAKAAAPASASAAAPASAAVTKAPASPAPASAAVAKAAAPAGTKAPVSLAPASAAGTKAVAAPAAAGTKAAATPSLLQARLAAAAAAKKGGADDIYYYKYLKYKTKYLSLKNNF
jgi:hypothetical protein